jgi:tol-pal system protein YbgF
MINKRSLSHYRSARKAVTSVTVFFASIVGLSLVSSVAAAESSSLTLEQRIKHLEELNQTRNQVQADISYQLSELQREVRLLTGQVEDNTFKLKQIQDRQRDLYREIEDRLAGGAATPPASEKASDKSASNTVVPAEQNNTQISDAQKNSVGAGRQFEAAFELVRNRKYDEALVAFDAFLIKHPNSNYSDNARYWMGQVYLVQGKLAEAEVQFTSLISEFPSSAKVNVAKLKLGDIYLKSERWAEAREQYTQVLNNSKGSQQQLARKGLDKLKKAGH